MSGNRCLIWRYWRRIGGTALNEALPSGCAGSAFGSVACALGGQCALSIADLSARGGERGRLGYAETRAYARSERRSCRKWQSREGQTMALFAALIEFTEDEELRLQTRPVHREYLRSLLDAGKLAISALGRRHRGVDRL